MKILQLVIKLRENYFQGNFLSEEKVYLEFI